MKVKRENGVANLSYKVERVNGGNQREKGKRENWRRKVEEKSGEKMWNEK